MKFIRITVKQRKLKKESEKYKVNDIKGKKETNKVRESAINKSERRK